MKSFSENKIRIELEPGETISPADFGHSRAAGMIDCVDKRRSMLPEAHQYDSESFYCEMQGDLELPNATVYCQSNRCAPASLQKAASRIISSVEREDNR